MKQSFRTHILESSLSRIQGKLTNHAIGAITAFRGNLTRNENLQRNKKLLAQLLRHEFQVTTVKGSYIEGYGSENEQEVGETSFVVVNPTKGDDQGVLEAALIELGTEYEQDSILSVPFKGEAVLVGTSANEDAFPSQGTKVKVGEAQFGVEGEFFSRVRGRPFKFAEAHEVEVPQTHNGKWALKLIAESNWQDIELSERELNE